MPSREVKRKFKNMAAAEDTIIKHLDGCKIYPGSFHSAFLILMYLVSVEANFTLMKIFILNST